MNKKWPTSILAPISFLLVTQSALAVPVMPRPPAQQASELKSILTKEGEKIDKNLIIPGQSIGTCPITIMQKGGGGQLPRKETIYIPFNSINLFTQVQSFRTCVTDVPRPLLFIPHNDTLVLTTSANLDLGISQDVYTTKSCDVPPLEAGELKKIDDLLAQGDSIKDEDYVFLKNILQKTAKTKTVSLTVNCNKLFASQNLLQNYVSEENIQTQRIALESLKINEQKSGCVEKGWLWGSSYSARGVCPQFRTQIEATEGAIGTLQEKIKKQQERDVSQAKYACFAVDSTKTALEQTKHICNALANMCPIKDDPTAVQKFRENCERSVAQQKKVEPLEVKSTFTKTNICPQGQTQAPDGKCYYNFATSKQSAGEKQVNRQNSLYPGFGNPAMIDESSTKKQDAPINTIRNSVIADVCPQGQTQAPDGRCYKNIVVGPYCKDGETRLYNGTCVKVGSKEVPPTISGNAKVCASHEHYVTGQGCVAFGPQKPPAVTPPPGGKKEEPPKSPGIYCKPDQVELYNGTCVARQLKTKEDPGVGGDQGEKNCDLVYQTAYQKIMQPVMQNMSSQNFGQDDTNAGSNSFVSGFMTGLFGPNQQSARKSSYNFLDPTGIQVNVSAAPECKAALTKGINDGQRDAYIAQKNQWAEQQMAAQQQRQFAAQAQQQQNQQRQQQAQQARQQQQQKQQQDQQKQQAAAQVPTLSCANVKAEKETITVGESVKIKFSIPNANQFELKGGPGSVDVSGATVRPTETTVYYIVGSNTRMLNVLAQAGQADYSGGSSGQGRGTCGPVTITVEEKKKTTDTTKTKQDEDGVDAALAGAQRASFKNSTPTLRCPATIARGDVANILWSCPEDPANPEGKVIALVQAVHEDGTELSDAERVMVRSDGSLLQELSSDGAKKVRPERDIRYGLVCKNAAGVRTKAAKCGIEVGTGNRARSGSSVSRSGTSTPVSGVRAATPAGIQISAKPKSISVTRKEQTTISWSAPSSYSCNVRGPSGYTSSKSSGSVTGGSDEVGELTFTLTCNEGSANQEQKSTTIQVVD